MADYRDKIKPRGGCLSLLDPLDNRKDAYRRKSVEMFVSGYTRQEIAEHFGKNTHAAGEIIRLAKKQLGAYSDISLVLIAHGIPVRHDRPLSRYMEITKASKYRPVSYAHRLMDLIVRGYTFPEMARMLGKSLHTLSVVGLKCREKLGMSSWVEVTLLAHDIIDGKEFCLDAMLGELTKKSLSGRLRGNAEQLPGPTAKVSPQESDADIEPGDRFNWRGRVHPLLP